jgi:flagellar biosynthetic protein FliR
MPRDLLSWLLFHAALAALVAARGAGVAWTAPALETPGLDVRFRVILAILLGVVLVPVLKAVGPVQTLTPLAFCAAFVVELLVGCAIGWSAAVIIGGARQAGEIVGAQAGFSAAALFDPEAPDELTPLGHLYGLFALAVFLALDGPLALVRGLVSSFKIIPVGTGGLSRETATLAFGRVGDALALALRAAAPAALALALASVALGLLGRAAPSLPLVALSMPIRAILGLVFVLLSLVTIAAILATAWSGWPGPW